MNFRRSLPEIRCAIICLTTTRFSHNRLSPHPFQEMHAGFGSCELLGDVHQVHVGPICTSLLALGPILFTQAKSMGRRSPRLRVDRRRTIFRVASTDRNQISGLSTSHKGTSGAFASAKKFINRNPPREETTVLPTTSVGDWRSGDRHSLLHA